MAQRNADWQNHISGDILKKGNCLRPLGVHYATPGTWCTLRVFLSDKADGIETLCSVLIKNPEDQQVQVPSSKSLGDSPGVYCEKEKMDLIKKRPEVFQKNTFTLMKAGYGLMMKLSF